MSGSNGYGSNGYTNGDGKQNGKPQPPPQSLALGGKGAAIEQGHTRSNVRLLVSAAVNGWLGEDDYGWVVETLKHVAATAKDPRARVSAAEGLVRVADLGLKLAEFEDKAGRLDSGQATERVEFDVKIPEARSRL